MGLIVFPLLPPPVLFFSFVSQYCLLCSPSRFALMDVVLLGCVDHPMGAASFMARSCPSVVVPTGDSWVLVIPNPGTDPHSIPTARAELLVQDPAGFWQISAASSPFGHNFVFKTSYSTAPSAPWSSATAPSLPLVFGGFVLEPFHLWKPNPALSSWMCLILGFPGVFCLLGLYGFLPPPLWEQLPLAAGLCCLLWQPWGSGGTTKFRQ